MKILQMISILGILLNPVVLDRYRNSTNNTGNSNYNNFVQCSYIYSVDNPSNEIDVSFAGWVGTTYEMPQVYKFTLKINFREPVHNATLLLSFTTPQTYSYTYNYIAENCFVTGSSGNITVTAYNTDYCLIEFYFSGHMLIEMYDYPITAVTTWSLDPTENIWVQSGYNYFDLTGVRLDSVSLEPTQNYNTELNSIIQNTDSIESLLNTLISNTDDVSRIDTNIQGIKSVLENILLAVNNIDNQIDTITWKDINISYLGYSSGYNGENLDTSSGYHNAGYYYLSSVNFNYVTSGGIFKLVIPLGAISSGTNIFDDWFFTNQIYQVVDGNRRTFQVDEYMVFQDRYKVTIYFTIDTEYNSYYPFGNYPLMFYIRERAYYYSNIDWQLQYIPKDDIEYWTIFNAIKNQSQFNVVQNIENILNTVYNGDYGNDVENTDNWFRSILQYIQLPNLPDMNDPKIILIPQLMESFTQIIDLQSLSLFKWVMSMIAIVGVFKVVTR